VATVAPAPFWWVPPLVVGLGIVGSLTAAYFTIRTNRRTARIKATIDLIEASESRDHYLALYRNYRRFRSDAEFKATVLAPRTEEDRNARHRCFDFLNHYELVAIGFKEGILDERFYRRWMGYAVMRDYREGRDLILTARAPLNPGDPGDVEAYLELERLCVSWGADPITPPRRLPAPTPRRKFKIWR
jgi:hypothetical protein